MHDESMLQALEHTADQIDHLAEIIDEFLTMAETRPLHSLRSQTDQYLAPCFRWVVEKTL